MALDRRWQTAERALVAQSRAGFPRTPRDGDAAVLGAKLQEMVAVLDHDDERHRLLGELVASGLDARQIENLVDEIEQMLARAVDVAEYSL